MSSNTKFLAHPDAVEQRRVLLTEIPGPASLELDRARVKAVSAGLGVTLPVFVARASGAVLVDVDGNQLIDLASGIAVTSVGASAPEVVEAVQQQVAAFTHTCFLVTEYAGYMRVAARLNSLLPGDFEKKTALFTTGAEAVENAVKIARTYTGRQGVVVFDHAYHGRTLLTMTMTAKNAPYKSGFGPFAPEVYRTETAHPLRGNREDSVERAFDRFRETVNKQIGPGNVAAVVAEPIIGEGGFIVPTPGFLPLVREFCREEGIVFVADEIQTGFGRTGALFASEHENLAPDLTCLAKALGGGMPISAVTGRAEVMDSVSPGALGGTYSGNPVACAAAEAVLDLIDSQDLVARAQVIEARVLPRLSSLADSSAVVADARGRGAMLALEFVRAGARLEPAPEIAAEVARRCHRKGVLVLVCGTNGNVIRLLPPLVIEFDLLDEAIDILIETVRTVEGEQ